MMNLAAALLAAVSIGQVPSPRTSGTGWITDLASLLPPGVESEINGRIDALNRDLGVEIAVVTVGNCTGTPDAFATGLFNTWGIGSRERNDGVLLLLVKDQRELVIRTGTGIEARLTEAWLGEMQDTSMLPSFKKGDFAAGFAAGIARIDGKLRETASVRPAATPVQLPATNTSTSASTYAPMPVLTPAPRPTIYGFRPRDFYRLLQLAAGCLVAGVVVAGSFFRNWWNRRCHTCKVQMALLDEIADDEHLTAAQHTEELIGSADWQVYVCPGCGATKQFAKAKMFSGYGRCRKCSTLAMKTVSRTITAATYDHGGQVEVTETCAHCNHVHTFTRNTPRLVRHHHHHHHRSSSRPSFSSSSRRSSGFGGGRSSGGGSSRKW